MHLTESRISKSTKLITELLLFLFLSFAPLFDSLRFGRRLERLLLEVLVRVAVSFAVCLSGFRTRSIAEPASPTRHRAKDAYISNSRPCLEEDSRAGHWAPGISTDAWSWIRSFGPPDCAAARVGAAFFP